MQYLVEKPIGKFAKGAHVSHEDFFENDPKTGHKTVDSGRAAELESRGLLTRVDGAYAEPRKDDLAGWQRRAKVLEADNKSLRTGGGGPELLGKISDLEAEVERHKADVAQLQTMNADLSQGVVKKAEYDNLNDQLTQLKTLHDGTVAELEALKAASADPKGK